MNDSKVEQWVKDITEDVFGRSPLKVGMQIKTTDGRLFKVISGYYWGEFGISNFWNFLDITNNGSGKEYCGYGKINREGKLDIESGYIKLFEKPQGFVYKRKQEDQK